LRAILCCGGYGRRQRCSHHEQASEELHRNSDWNTIVVPGLRPRSAAYMLVWPCRISSLNSGFVSESACASSAR
jgi:hypothetical protein